MKKTFISLVFIFTILTFMNASSVEVKVQKEKISSINFEPNDECFDLALKFTSNMVEFYDLNDEEAVAVFEHVIERCSSE